MMKNKFLFLIVLGLAFLTSCSDDDKDSPKDFNGTYSTTSTDHVLDLKYSDIVLTGKNVEFNSADGVKATLRLKGVVPGEEETVISDIELVESNSIHTFAAENKSDVRTVTLSGSIEKGKLTLGVNVKFVENDLMKKWNLTGVKMTWLPRDYVLMETPKKMNTGGFATLLSLSGMMLKQYLQDVTFQEDGNIVATYNAATATDENPEPEADWRQSPLNLAHYCVKDGICYVYLNLDMIMNQANMDQVGRSTGVDPTFAVLEKLLTEGIPVHFEIASGSVYVYVDEVLVKQLSPLLPMVGSLIPDDYEIPVLKVPAKALIESLPGALAVTTEMKVGLKLAPAK